MKVWQSFESILDSTLSSNLYKVENPKDYNFLNSLVGGKHRPDKIIKDTDNRLIIISKKWQEGPGTADEKLMYEIIKLINLVENYKEVKSVYILIGGNGWREGLKSFWLSQSWNNYLDIKYRSLIKVVTIDDILPLILRRML